MALLITWWLWSRPYSYILWLSWVQITWAVLWNVGLSLLQYIPWPMRAKEGHLLYSIMWVWGLWKKSTYGFESCVSKSIVFIKFTKLTLSDYHSRSDMLKCIWSNRDWRVFCINHKGEPGCICYSCAWLWSSSPSHRVTEMRTKDTCTATVYVPNFTILM